jgi:hypothetical protein
MPRIMDQHVNTVPLTERARQLINTADHLFAVAEGVECLFDGLDDAGKPMAALDVTELRALIRIVERCNDICQIVNDAMGSVDDQDEFAANIAQTLTLANDALTEETH